MIKNIIFDVGDGLVEYRWHQMLMDYGLDKDEAYRLGITIFEDPLWHELDMAIMDREEVIKSYREKYVEDADTIEWFINHGEYMHVQRKDVYKRISVGEILSVYLNEITNNEDFIGWSRKNMNVILVDEAQDLTIENYQIFDILLAKIPELKLFLVGDPRQNIFGFLGGSFDNLDQFLKKYEGQISKKALSYSY